MNEVYTLTIAIKDLKYYDTSRNVCLNENGEFTNESFIGEPDGLIVREWPIGACTDFIDFFDGTFIVLAGTEPRLFVRQGDLEFFCSPTENVEAFHVYMNALMKNVCR